MVTTHSLLLEIGVEELPASFVRGALDALPVLATQRLGALRLLHGSIRALGTPRRLALIVEEVSDRQTDLTAEVLGPPAAVAFDAAGKLTRAGEAFATKQGIPAGELVRRETPKGEYLAGTRRETGRSTIDLLGPALEAICSAIPFRKVMRWGNGDATFGRPVRWLLALYGDHEVPATFAGATAGRITYGHRFLAPEPITLPDATGYEAALKQAHVWVDPAARQAAMLRQLHAAAAELGGSLIDDAFLVAENLQLVEESTVLAGSFEERFLTLPEEVILEVARGHQRYFGVRGSDGTLLPRYLAVAGTALQPETIRRGNDRVMRARLSDAQFFYDEDRKHGLHARTAKLEGVVFHHKLGSIGAKVQRLGAWIDGSGELFGLDETVVRVASQAAALCKSDLVSLLVGEFPELQGRMGKVYAQAAGEPAPVADAICDHYLPKGASDPTATAPSSALLALADRVDSLVGCFAIGLSPTGTADPYALRRACLGSLRTILDQNWDVSLRALLLRSYGTYQTQNVTLTLDENATADKLSSFFHDRLRHLLADTWPSDVVDACLALGSDHVLDIRQRIAALAELAPDLRASVGEVFKRVTNIAKDAPDGEPAAPRTVDSAPHESEEALFEAWQTLTTALQETIATGNYPQAFQAIAELAPRLHTYFSHVFVMTDDLPVRNNRLRLMRALRDQCSTVAHVQLLTPGASAPGRTDESLPG